MSINFSGIITYQTSDGKVKLSIVDKPTCEKLGRVVKTGRKPFDDETFQIVLNSKTIIISGVGRWDYEYLPKLIGWRCTGKLKVKKYSFKSTWSENSGDLVEGVSLACLSLHAGSD